MKNLLTFILCLIVLTPTVMSQEREKGYYKQQFTKLSRIYSENPQNVINLLDMAIYYADTNNPIMNLPKAKKYIDSAEYHFKLAINNTLEPKLARKILKQGVTIEKIIDQKKEITKIARAYVKKNDRMNAVEISNFAEAFEKDGYIIRDIEQRRIYAEWDKTQKENTFEAYLAFQNKYPNTAESETANDKMKVLAKELFRKCKTDAEVDNQLEPYKQIAAVKYAAIQHKAHLAYLQAESINTIRAYRRYIKHFPSGDDYAQAMNQISKLLVTQFSSLTSAQDLVDFIVMNGDDPMADQAMIKLRNKILYEQDLYALDLYLKNFPLDPSRNDIYRQYYDWHVYEGDIQPILDFEKNNPDFPFELAIRRDLRLAEQRSDIDLRASYKNSQFETYAGYLRRLTGYGLAYVTLQRIIQPYVAQKNWKRALDRLDYFMLSFDSYDADRFQKLKQMLAAPIDKAKTLSTEVKPGYNMMHPIKTEDGSTLYYTKVEKGKSVIWTAKYVNGRGYKWIGEAPVEFENDSNIDLTMFCLYDNEQKMLVGRNGDIYTATRNGEKWLLGEAMPAPINTEYIETDAFMLSDGSGMLLASDRPYGHNFHRSGTLFHGDTALATDIYYIPYTLDGWGEAINLGLNVNGPYCDRSPVMSKDLKTLYFVSDGRAGFGYEDVFKTYREDITDWTHWQMPENLGKEVNTGYRESSVSISGDDQRLLIASNRDGGKYGCYSLKSQHEEGAALVKVKIDGKAFGKELLYLGIVDITTHTLVHSIDIEMPEKELGLYGDRKYALVAEIADQYFPAMMFTPQENSLIKPEEPYSGSRLVASYEEFEMNAIRFEEGSKTPYDYSIQELQRLGRFLRQHSNIRIELSINANTEDDLKSYNLSLERGRTIKKILMDAGVHSNQISISALGNLNYKKDTNTPQVVAKFSQL